ncbi:putative ABC transport system ATP-binding protein [Arboricoccus pini]|uniref:Putative ABC transport system ATP-binding protein n=1 Tax=Arboricoccus pini TaxID=1963835 RepID=A0A212Q8X0_9PROT|nr:ATP-binding cassette domain-containing protein [Arboricoccus pini]SNB55757.1 putative ABC transport system ATP-binding protein [Arboricoccus pini]
MLTLDDVALRRDASFELVVRHFAVAPGEAVAIVGQSGSGKSTCLDIMAGILKPDRAQRFTFHHAEDAPISLADLWQRHDRGGLRNWRARHLGYVLQTGGLVPFLSLADNVGLPLRLLGRREPGRVQELLQALGLDGLGRRKPRHVSIGQRQRAALARALAARPALLLADEPTASLDRDSAETVMGLLTSAARRENAALVMVTHDRDLAVRHGLRIATCASGGALGLSVLDDRETN